MNRDHLNGRIMIVDDDGMFRKSLVQNLSDAGFATSRSRTATAALSHLSDAGPPT